MKERLKDSNRIMYFIIIVILLSIVTFLIYTTYSTSKNINNNSNILEENNIVNTYEELTSPILYEIASYSTKIYDTDKNRIHNITLACNTLDKTIVKSGDEFSFNNTLGKMDKEDGYKKAIGFDSNGKKIKMYGGGICQLSSTLYNAVLIGNLEVTERHAHSKRVNYVPKNKDATVYYGGPDFKFINNTENDIIIYTKTDGNTVNVTLMTEIQKISKPLM